MVFVRALAVGLAVATLVGCGSERVKSESPPPDEETTPDEEPSCPPGELEQPDGSCRSAGIGADACGEGFVHDGEDACDPVLPREPCAPGLMAIPGETECREVAPCGAGQWGDVPIEANSQHVDAAYAGGDSDGSAAKPWVTVQEAIAAAEPNAIVALAAGSYVEHVLLLGKAVRLWGKCPEEVAIVGPPGAVFALDIRAGADGTEVRDLAISGDGYGLAVAGSVDVVGDRLWIHDNSSLGWSVQNFGGVTSAALRRSLVESVTDIGVYGLGSSLQLEGSVVRGTRVVAPTFGRGVHVIGDGFTMTPSDIAIRRSVIAENPELGALAMGSSIRIEDSVVGHTEPTPGGGTAVFVARQFDTGVQGHGVVRRSVIERANGVGIYVADSNLDIEATVVRDIAPTMDDLDGMGILSINALPELPAWLTLRGSVVMRTRTCGVCLAGIDASVESLVVRDVEPQASDGIVGRGISFEAFMDTAGLVTGAMLLRGSLVERTYEAGVALIASEGTIESTVVRDIAPRGDGFGGRGIDAEIDPISGVSANAHIDNVLIERCHEFGIFIGGAEATIQRSTIRDISARPVDGAGGVGITIQMSFETGAPSNGTILTTLVERTQQGGLAVIGASATFTDVVVRDSMPDGNGAFGDGLVTTAAFYNNVLIPSATHVASSLIASNARAGVLAFATDVTLVDNQFECNAIHLNGEPYEDIGFVIDDLGGNSCGCNGAASPCKVLSSNLEVPGPIN